jgi:hypothetical protein
MSTTGAGIQFQLRGFGGASFVNGNTPGSAGLDGDILFHLGNRILVGPTAGFQWVDNSIVNSIGSQQTGSTFIHTGAGFKQGNFGGGFVFQVSGTHAYTYPWMFGIHAGATVANSTITQAEGFCGPNTTNPTAPPGCTVLSTTTTHDTVVGPFVDGYVAPPVHFGFDPGWAHYEVYGLARWFTANIGRTTSAGTTSGSSGGSQTGFDVNRVDVGAGIIFTFGRHER